MCCSAYRHSFRRRRGFGGQAEVDLSAFGGAHLRRYAQIAQLVERIHGKDEVTGSNPVLGSIKLHLRLRLTSNFV